MKRFISDKRWGHNVFGCKQDYREKDNVDKQGGRLIGGKELR